MTVKLCLINQLAADTLGPILSGFKFLGESLSWFFS